MEWWSDGFMNYWINGLVDWVVERLGLGGGAGWDGLGVHIWNWLHRYMVRLVTAVRVK